MTEFPVGSGTRQGCNLYAFDIELKVLANALDKQKYKVQGIKKKTLKLAYDHTCGVKFKKILWIND